MMDSFISAPGPVLALTILALAGCGSAPPVNDPGAASAETANQPAATSESPGEQVGDNESRPGSSIYAQGSRVTCKKRRRTGSNLKKSSCDKSISSQPVRPLMQNDPALAQSTASGGSARPQN